MSPQIEEVLPKYLQVANYIRDQILRGELQPGDELPSERQIVEDWKVSRPTATRALATLRVEGLVDSRQGAGTFVRPRPPFSRLMRDRDARARPAGRASERTEVVRAELAAAPEEVVAVLNLEGGRAICRHCITYDQSEPVEVTTSWFSEQLAQLAPQLLERVPLKEGTLAYIEQQTGRRGERAWDQHSVRLATSEEMAELQLPGEAAAVGVIRHTVYDREGNPVEFSEGVYPADQWRFEEDYPLQG